MSRLLVISGLFFVTILIMSLGLSREVRNRYVSDVRSTTISVGTTNTAALEMQLDRSLGTTLALAASIRNDERQLLENFDAVAHNLTATYGYVDNLQLAPGGVVSYIYPLEGNEEAIGHDLLNDPARRAEALKTIESRDLTLAGPFDLVQGGTGIIRRYPVFLSDESGVDRFWGFTVALIHLSPLLDAVGFPNLTQSHDYELSRIPPDTGTRQVFSRSSTTSIRDGAAMDITVPNATWTLTLIPKSGWVPTWLGVLLLAGPLAAAGGSSALFLAYLVQRRKKRVAEEKLKEVDRHLREQAEESLAESEARFHQVAENLTTALSLKGSEGNEILYANRAWRDMWGAKDPQERLQLIHPDDRELLQLVSRQREDGLRDSVTLEYRMVLEDGDIRWIEAQSIPILNNRGEIYR